MRATPWLPSCAVMARCWHGGASRCNECIRHFWTSKEDLPPASPGGEVGEQTFLCLKKKPPPKVKLLSSQKYRSSPLRALLGRNPIRTHLVKMNSRATASLQGAPPPSCSRETNGVLISSSGLLLIGTAFPGWGLGAAGASRQRPPRRGRWARRLELLLAPHTGFGNPGVCLVSSLSRGTPNPLGHRQ